MSDEEGFIRFHMEPVISDLTAGRRISDTFYLYRTEFFYQLSKEGYVPHSDRVVDEQEYSSFSDPTYQGLDRTPTDKPIIIPVTLAAYQDFLTQKMAPPAEALKPFIDTLLESALDFRPLPHSMELTSKGRFRMEIEFEPLFDPAEMVPEEAGAMLLRGPVRKCLSGIENKFSRIDQIKSYEIKVLSRFQSRSSPFEVPVDRTFIFRFPAYVAIEVMDWTPGRFLFAEGLEVTLENRKLDLTAHFEPEAAPLNKENPANSLDPVPQ